MIAEAIATILFSFITGLISLLPNPETLPSFIDSAFTSIAPFWGFANYFFPVTVLVSIFILGMAIEGSILGFKIVNWVYNKFRGSG